MAVVSSATPPAAAEEATRLLYLEDTFVLEGTARVVKVLPQKPGVATLDVVLDQTLFYPGGGGQPCDTGVISTASGARYVVERVAPAADNHSVVVHTLSAAKADALSPGDVVTLAVDAEKRILHAKLHTGGHLLDCCMARIGHPMEPTKGMHFPTGTYVGYALTSDMPAEKRAAIVGQLNEEAARLIREGSAVRVELVPPAEARSRLGVAELPSYLPRDKPVRFVAVASQAVGYPCAGTHLKTLAQLNSLTVTKITKKGHELRVSYTVS